MRQLSTWRGRVLRGCVVGETGWQVALQGASLGATPQQGTGTEQGQQPGAPSP